MSRAKKSCEFESHHRHQPSLVRTSYGWRASFHPLGYGSASQSSPSGMAPAETSCHATNAGVFPRPSRLNEKAHRA